MRYTEIVRHLATLLEYFFLNEILTFDTARRKEMFKEFRKHITQL